jgi:hypothetical protein
VKNKEKKKKKSIIYISIIKTIVLKPDLTLQVDPADPGLELSRVEEKIEEKKTRCDPIDPARPGQKLDCNLLIFVFFY